MCSRVRTRIDERRAYLDDISAARRGGNIAYTPAALTSSVPLHTFWSFGTLRCVMLPAARPPRCVVQVLDDAVALRVERCDTPEHAAALAERLWRAFVENAT